MTEDRAPENAEATCTVHGIVELEASREKFPLGAHRCNRIQVAHGVVFPLQYIIFNLLGTSGNFGARFPLRCVNPEGV